MEEREEREKKKKKKDGVRLRLLDGEGKEGR